MRHGRRRFLLFARRLDTGHHRGELIHAPALAGELHGFQRGFRLICRRIQTPRECQRPDQLQPVIDPARLRS